MDKRSTFFRWASRALLALACLAPPGTIYAQTASAAASDIDGSGGQYVRAVVHLSTYEDFLGLLGDGAHLTLLASADNVGWDGNLSSVVWVKCATADCDNVVWGNDAALWSGNVVWGNAVDSDNVVWGNAVDSDNVVWGNAVDADNVVWGNGPSIDADNVVWGNGPSIDADNVVWGNGPSIGADNVVWGNVVVVFLSGVW